MKMLLAVAAVGTVLSAFQAHGAEGPWMVRLRAVDLNMENESKPIPALGVPSDVIHVEDKIIPEVDISYFFTKNLATELILTYPQKHEVTISGTKIGTFKHLPPTLTLQYHFLPDSAFRPYVGVGINYTRISSVNLSVPGVGKLDLERDSWGGALQVGFDYRLTNNLFLNVDVKKIYLDADLKAGGTKVSKLTLDPLAIGIGIGWRF